MKILYVVHGFPPRNTAGTETYTYSLAQGVSREHDVGVFYRFADREKPEYLMERGTYEGIDYWAINNTYGQRSDFEAYYRHPELDPAFRSCLDEFHPDLVHFAYVLGGLTADYVHHVKARHVPIVITLTDFVQICCRGQLLDREGRVCAGPKGGFNCIPCLWNKPSPLEQKGWVRLAQRIFPADMIARWVNHEQLHEMRARLSYLRDTVNMADLVIAPTEFLGETYRAWGIDTEKLMFSEFGINPDFFADYRLEPSDIARFGFIGQLLPHKGLHVFTKALTLLTSDQYKGVIYGDSSSEDARNYLNEALDQCDGERVEYRGTFPAEDIAKIYAEIDVLVVPSLWHENSPLVVLYALHTRTPLIVSDMGGMNGLVEHGHTGFVFPAGDAERLAFYMQYFIDHPEAIQSMKEKPKPVKTIEENVRELVALYRELTAS